MEISINGLLERCDDALTAEATASFRARAGLASAPTRAALVKEYDALCDVESFQRVREATERTRIEASRREALKPFLVELARWVALAHTAPALDALDALLDSRVDVGTRTEPLRFGLEALGEETSRERRVLLQRKGADALEQHQGLFASRLEGLAASAQALGFPDAVAQAEALGGRPLAPALEQAKAFLAQTEDAYRDVLAWSVKKLNPELKPSELQLHDAQAATAAVQLHPLFPHDALLPSIARLLEDCGLAPNAGGRLALDSEAREGKGPGASVHAVSVPDEVRLVMTRASGLDAWAGLLHAFGVAQQQANVNEATPWLQRRLGDAEVPQAFGALFSQLLVDESFLKRTLRLNAPTARETARHAALRALFLLRAKAAVFPVSIELMRRGPSPAIEEDFAQRLHHALGVAVPGARVLYDAAPSLAGVEAACLGAQLRGVLLEKFNEDYWRNPATGRYLLGLFARGQAVDVRGLAQEQCGGPLGSTALGRRLVEVLGA